MTTEELFNKWTDIEKSISNTEVYFSNLKAIVQNDTKLNVKCINKFNLGIMRYIKQRRINENAIRLMVNEIVRFYQR